LPSAFIPFEPDNTAQNVLEYYCELMEEWVRAVRDDGDFENVFPIAAARTAEHADMLEHRLLVLREDIVPEAPAELIDTSNSEKPSAK
jgi:hypothetical protein